MARTQFSEADEAQARAYIEAGLQIQRDHGCDVASVPAAVVEKAVRDVACATANLRKLTAGRVSDAVSEAS